MVEVHVQAKLKKSQNRIFVFLLLRYMAKKSVVNMITHESLKFMSYRVDREIRETEKIF